MKFSQETNAAKCGCMAAGCKVLDNKSHCNLDDVGSNTTQGSRRASVFREGFVV